MYTLNLHRIEKDVQRCDRNYWYFTPANLEKLRNIMCRWVVNVIIQLHPFFSYRLLLLYLFFSYAHVYKTLMR